MVQVYIYNPAKMAKEKSTMMRLPHWIVRRTLACLRWCSNIQFLSKLISLLFREKKKLQDELNQLSRNCLKDVQSRSTLYKYNFNSRSIFFSSGIQRLYKTASPLVRHNHRAFKIQRSTQSLMPSTLPLCNQN